MTDTGPVRPLRLLVVDDHEVVRQGLVAMLDRRPGFEVVAQAGSVAESIYQARLHQPDIVVMDVRLPDGSGVEACRAIRDELPGTRVIMLTSFPDDEALSNDLVVVDDQEPQRSNRSGVGHRLLPVSICALGQHRDDTGALSG